MAASVQVEVRETRGPWPYIVIEGRKQGHVMRVVPLHPGPGLAIPIHASKPKVFPGVWDFPAEPQERAGGIKFIAVQLEMLPQDSERVYNSGWWQRFEIVMEEAGVGFFNIKGRVVSDYNIRNTKQLMEVLDQGPVTLKVLLKAGIVGKCFNRNVPLSIPTKGE